MHTQNEKWMQKPLYFSSELLALLAQSAVVVSSWMCRSSYSYTTTHRHMVPPPQASSVKITQCLEKLLGCKMGPNLSGSPLFFFCSITQAKQMSRPLFVVLIIFPGMLLEFRTNTGVFHWFPDGKVLLLRIVVLANIRLSRVHRPRWTALPYFPLLLVLGLA